MADPAEIRKLGYDVAEVKDGFLIRGYGVSSFYTLPELDGFTVAHAERVKQYEDGPPPPPPPGPTLEGKIAAEFAKLKEDTVTAAELLRTVQSVFAPS